MSLLYKYVLFSFFPAVWYQMLTESLDLAEGSGTLVLELGVEKIAAADGGDVEACVLRPNVSLLWFFLFVCVILLLCLFPLLVFGSGKRAV